MDNVIERTVTISDIDITAPVSVKGGESSQGVKVLDGREMYKGDKGDPGESAYELAVANGFGGTEEEWLESLHGRDGKDGVVGRDGVDGYTPVKGVDYFDGKDGYTPIKGVDYFDGEDGYTPQKGVDYFDGKDGRDGSDGAPGRDGHTPVKGVDYFDGKDGAAGPQGPAGYTPQKGIDYFDGKDGKDGYTPVKGVDYFDGQDGKDGYTPVKGKDYFDGSDGKDGIDGKTPVKGVDYFDGKNGSDGKDGTSPTVSVTAITGGHRISITDANGTKIVDVMDGLDGAAGSPGKDGSNGSDGKDGNDGVGIASIKQTTTSTADDGNNIITVTLTNGQTATFTVQNGSKGSAGKDGVDGKDGSDANVTATNIKSALGYDPAKQTDVESLSEEIADLKAGNVEVDLTGYATETYVKNYSQPKGDYALKTEIPSVHVASVNGKTGAVVLDADDVGAATESWVQLKIEDLKAQGLQLTPLYAQGETVTEALAWLTENGDTSKLYVLPDNFIYGYIKTAVAGGAGYTNQVPISTDTDGSIFNGTGYKNDVRLGSAGTISSEAQAGSTTIGFIPFKPKCTVRIQNADFLNVTGGHYYFVFYDASKTKKQHVSNSNMTNNDGQIVSVCNYDASTGITTITFSGYDGSEYGRNINASSFIRMTVKGDGANLIVTVDEEIKEAEPTEKYQWASTGRAFVPADYEDRIVDLEEQVNGNTVSIAELEQEVNDILDGTTEIAASTKFDPTAYRLPILYLTGDTEGMNKEVKKTLTYAYGDKTGSCTCKWQGATSTYWDKKNYTIVFDNPFEVKDGWGEQKKYCFKANWIDHSHARNIVSCKLWGKVVKSRSTVPTELANLPNGGAIDGFPCIIMLNGEFHGLYTWNIPKDGWMFGLVEDTTKTQAIVGANQHTTATQFKGEVAGDESDFELEFVSDEDNTAWVNTSLNRLINACIASNGTDLDTTVAQYLDWDSAIDYYIQTVVEQGTDAVDKNFLLVTFDGVKWYFSNYDRDTTYGLAWDGSALSRPTSYITFTECATTSRVFELIKNFKKDKLKARYTQLRSDILSESRICQQFENFVWDISSPILLEDVKKWTSIRGSSVNGIDQICRWVRQRLETTDKWINQL